jgi:hypothetical protein
MLKEFVPHNLTTKDVLRLGYYGNWPLLIALCALDLNVSDLLRGPRDQRLELQFHIEFNESASSYCRWLLLR